MSGTLDSTKMARERAPSPFLGKNVDMTDNAGPPDAAAPDPEIERKLAEKDREFKRVVQRYARMRSRAAK